MLHPIVSLLMNRPDLVVDHLAGYAELASEEAVQAGDVWLGRLVAWLLTVLLAAVFVALAGGAVMLGAIQQQFHWALVAVPGTVGLLALLAWHLARRPAVGRAFGELRHQVQADLVAFKNAGKSRTASPSHA